MKKRLPAKQKDFDIIKRRTETAIIAAGGTFEDMRSGSAIVSIYYFNGCRAKYKWHCSYSARNSILKVDANTRRLLKKIGINSVKSNDNIEFWHSSSMH